MSSMNRYGTVARQHWTQVDPYRVAAIDDPETFFRDLGEQVEIRVQGLADALAGPDRPGETYLEKVGRLNMARLQAEEATMTELVWLGEPDQTPDPGTGAPTGGRSMVDEFLWGIHYADPDNEPTENPPPNR